MKKRLMPLLCTSQRKNSFDDQISILYDTNDEAEIEFVEKSCRSFRIIIQSDETIRNHLKIKRSSTFIKTFRTLYRRITNGFHRRSPTVRREINLEPREIDENIYETIPFESPNITSIETTTESIDYRTTRIIPRSRPEITWKHSWNFSETKDALLASPFSSIPVEIYLEIFLLLSTRDLGNVSLVCRKFKMIVDDDEIWKLKCKTSNKLISKSCKQIYMDWTYEIYLRGINYDYEYAQRQYEYITLLIMEDPLIGLLKYPTRPLSDKFHSSITRFNQHPNSSQEMTIKLSVDLDETVFELHSLLEKISIFQNHWLQESTTIKQMILRYYRFMQLKALYSSSILLIPTLDIEIIWQTHLSRPEIYRTDCIRLFGRIIDHFLSTDHVVQFLKDQAFIDTCQLYEEYFGEQYCILPMNMDHRKKTPKYEKIFTDRGYRYRMLVYPYWDETYFQFNTEIPDDYINPFSFTESDIMVDNDWFNSYQNFMFEMRWKISNGNHQFFAEDEKNLNSTEMTLLKKSYERFLYITAKYPSIDGHNVMPPTYAIDLIWRAHMQEPLKYASDCHRYIGYVLNHVPWSLNETNEMMEFNKTNDIWKREFNNDITTDHLYRIQTNNYN